MTVSGQRHCWCLLAHRGVCTDSSVAKPLRGEPCARTVSPQKAARPGGMPRGHSGGSSRGGGRKSGSCAGCGLPTALPLGAAWSHREWFKPREPSLLSQTRPLFILPRGSWEWYRKMPWKTLMYRYNIKVRTDCTFRRFPSILKIGWCYRCWMTYGGGFCFQPYIFKNKYFGRLSEQKQ